MRRSYPHQGDLVALLSFEVTPNSSISQLDEGDIMKVTEVLSKKSGDAKLEALRCSGLQLLMKFSSPAGYEALGKSFLDGKIEEIGYLKLIEIQGMCTLYATMEIHYSGTHLIRTPRGHTRVSV